jgi:hypothetical protein
MAKPQLLDKIITYYLADGTECTAAEIRAAFEAGTAVLVLGHADHTSSVGVMLDGKHFDTRGQCYSMWEEQWTLTPKKAEEAMHYARVTMHRN